MNNNKTLTVKPQPQTLLSPVPGDSGLSLLLTLVKRFLKPDVCLANLKLKTKLTNIICGLSTIFV